MTETEYYQEGTRFGGNNFKKSSPLKQNLSIMNGEF